MELFLSDIDIFEKLFTEKCQLFMWRNVLC